MLPEQALYESFNEAGRAACLHGQSRGFCSFVVKPITFSFYYVCLFIFLAYHLSNLICDDLPHSKFRKF